MKNGVVFKVDGVCFSYKSIVKSKSYVLLKDSIPVGYTTTEKEAIIRLFNMISNHLKKRKDFLNKEIKACNKAITTLGKHPTNLERFKV
jgi:glutamate racemase